MTEVTVDHTARCGLVRGVFKRGGPACRYRSVEALGGLLLIVGVACVGGGLLMDSTYGGGVKSQSSIPVWRGFRLVGAISIVVGVAFLGLAMLLG